MSPAYKSNIYSISQLNQTVKQALRQLSFEGLWVKGEILSYKMDSAGRYSSFLLCEKEEHSNKVVAQVQAMCWGADLKDINYKLRNIDSGLVLKDGLNVQIKVMLDLWPQAGRFQVMVKDIEPSFTLGELHLSRHKIYHELVQLGVHEKNKLLEVPLCPLRIALITSRDCAGYNDFLAEIKSSGLPFAVDFYHAAVQGEGVEREVIKAINAIKRRQYDVVVIVRGGGAVTDLKWFDNLNIGKAIANCPLPVLTGIGHEINLTVADMVACQNFKTPTAAAGFLIDKVNDYQRGLEQIIRDLQQAVAQATRENRTYLKMMVKEMEKSARDIFSQKRGDLSNLSDNLKLFDPVNTLKLGYAITRASNGKIVKGISQIQQGDDLITQLSDGKIFSRATGKE